MLGESLDDCFWPCRPSSRPSPTISRHVVSQTHRRGRRRRHSCTLHSPTAPIVQQSIPPRSTQVRHWLLSRCVLGPSRDRSACRAWCTCVCVCHARCDRARRHHCACVVRGPRWWMCFLHFGSLSSVESSGSHRAFIPSSSSACSSQRLPVHPFIPHHHAVAFPARWTAHHHRRRRLGASAPLCHLRKEADDTDSRQDLLDRAPRGVKRSRSPDDFGDAGPPGSAGDDGMLCCVSVSVCAAVLA